MNGSEEQSDGSVDPDVSLGAALLLFAMERLGIFTDFEGITQLVDTLSETDERGAKGEPAERFRVILLSIFAELC